MKQDSVPIPIPGSPLIPRSPLRFAIWATRGNRHLVAICWCAVIAGMVMTRAELLIIKQLVDAVSQLAELQGDLSSVWMLALAIPVLYVIGECMWRTSGFTAQRWMTSSTAKVYQSLFSYLTGHSARYFQERFAGAVTNKISNAAQGVIGLYQIWTWQFQTLLVGIVLDLCLLIYAHYLFAVVLSIWLVIFFAVNLTLVFRLRVLAYQHAEAASTLKGKLVDSTTNIDSVHQLAQELYEQSYVDRYISKEKDAHRTNWFQFEWILVANGLLLGVFFLAMFSLSIKLLEQQALTVGGLVLVITIVFELERKLFFLGEQMSRAMQLYGQIAEGLDELLKPHEITVSPDAPQLKVTNGAIEFSSVNFSYEQSEIFRDLNLSIAGGEKIGLVGPSGAGKSTIVNLLLRQYDLSAGSIEIDKQDISGVELKSLRKHISLVPQSTNLFHRTLRDNIRYGRLDASDQEVEKAAQLAQAGEFIDALAQGYDTFVGERGVKLSGGQRQRISIARAILKDAPILVLDEATSSLDSHSEAAIQTALESLMSGRTVLAIAHRLSTLRSMDRIIVIDRGEIVESASHTELIKKQGLYAQLWEQQVGGFLPG